MALPALMQDIQRTCEQAKQTHPMDRANGVPYCGVVVGTAYRNLVEGKPISEKLRGFPAHAAPFQSALELCLKCGEALRKAGVPLSRETLTETLSLNWKDKYEIYDMVQRHPFEKIVLPDFNPEPEPEPVGGDGLGLTVRGGRVVVSSRDVARIFEKEHRNVLRDVQSLDCTKDFHSLNFEQMMETVDIGKGAKRSFPIYLMTRDGFVFLAMGYTGKRAARFKEAYINRFNEMEKQLNEEMRALLAPPQLPEPKPSPSPERKEKVKRYYTPEEAAEALGYPGYKTFYATMIAAGYFVRVRGRCEPKPEYVRQKLFAVKQFRSGVGGKNKWKRPVVTHAGILYLSRLMQE